MYVEVLLGRKKNWLFLLQEIMLLKEQLEELKNKYIANSLSPVSIFLLYLPLKMSNIVSSTSNLIDLAMKKKLVAKFIWQQWCTENMFLLQKTAEKSLKKADIAEKQKKEKSKQQNKPSTYKVEEKEATEEGCVKLLDGKIKVGMERNQ